MKRAGGKIGNARMAEDGTPCKKIAIKYERDYGRE